MRPVVTLAVLYGAGGSAVGPRVAERLGVQFLDRAIPNSVAKRAGLSGAVAVGAVVLASVSGALYVYLGGSRARRIERIMDLRGVDRSTAARLVKVNDRARRDYVSSVYGIEATTSRSTTR